MAARGTARRVNERSDTMQYRVSGTTAYVPERLPPKRARIREVSSETRRNRAKASALNLYFVIFLTLVSIATVYTCVRYLQLKATLKAQITANEKLESTLVNLRSENDALLENVNNTQDWNHIKDVAINELGMKYATEDQIVWYNTDDCSYVRQYSDVPK